MRKEIPLAVGIGACLVVTLEWFFKVPAIIAWSKGVQDWMIVLSACAMGLGATSLIMRHGSNVSRRGKNWPFSVAVFVGMLGFPLASMAAGGLRSEAYTFMFNNVYSPISSTFFSILVFYTASAAYRTFRLRNFQAGLLLISAILLMIGKVPIGNVMWSGFPTISTWLLQYPVAAANRGILIGSSVGLMAVGIRYLVGLERIGQDQ